MPKKNAQLADKIYVFARKFCEALLKTFRQIFWCPKNWLDYSIKLARTGNCSEAMNACDKAIELDPKYIDAWQHKGTLFLNEQQYENSLKCFSKITSINEKLDYAWITQADIFARSGKNIDAVSAYKRALGLNPKLADVWEKLADLVISDSLKQAKDCYQKSIEIEPGRRKVAKKLDEVSKKK